MEWLTQQQGLSGEVPSHEAEKTQDAALTLEDTININHLIQKDSIDNVHNKFSVSSSAAIGIVCQLGSPSLSVIYPGSSRPPQILSTKGRNWSAVFKRNSRYWSVVFMMNLGKECLAATCSNDNTIHLWNLEDSTSSVVCKQNSDEKKSMNLCLIDDRTVAYGEVIPSGEDGSHKIYILMTNTQPWSMSSTLLVRGVKRINDMCYMKTADGTACLFLACPDDDNVQAVEIVRGQIRWKVGDQQMGTQGCYPWSICTDENNTVYVADSAKCRIHILSGEDGSVIKSIKLRPYSVWYLSSVRVHDEHIYIGHVDDLKKKYQISKFNKPIDW